MQKINLKLNSNTEKNSFLISEAYKFLRTNIRFCGQNIKVIAVTSCYENEGKTTVSLYLAKSFAELGKRTLLIDADMRKSVLAARDFGLANVEGLSEMLTAVQTDINKCIFQTDVNNLFIMFSGSIPPNPVELLSSKYFDAIITTVRESFDYIIVDTPPLALVTDAAVIAPRCDGSVLVIGSNNIKVKEAKNVLDQLKASGSKILGAVRNSTSKGNKKYYKYSYYRKYHKYE